MKSSNYKELRVWQKSMDLTTKIYNLVKLLPKEETYALSDQMRRAAISIPSNIAEGQGRNSDKEYINFLSIARGSLWELETQLEICVRLGYVEQSIIADTLDLITEVSKMINGLSIFLMSKRLSGYLMGVSINLSHSEKEELFINNTSQ